MRLVILVLLDELDQEKHIYKRLVSKETVVTPLWGSQPLKFGIKQVDKGYISTVSVSPSLEKNVMCSL